MVSLKKENKAVFKDLIEFPGVDLTTRDKSNKTLEQIGYYCVLWNVLQGEQQCSNSENVAWYHRTPVGGPCSGCEEHADEPGGS